MPEWLRRSNSGAAGSTAAAAPVPASHSGGGSTAGSLLGRFKTWLGGSAANSTADCGIARTGGNGSIGGSSTAGRSTGDRRFSSRFMRMQSGLSNPTFRPDYTEPSRLGVARERRGDHRDSIRYAAPTCLNAAGYSAGAASWGQQGGHFENRQQVLHLRQGTQARGDFGYGTDPFNQHRGAAGSGNIDSGGGGSGSSSKFSRGDELGSSGSNRAGQPFYRDHSTGSLVSGIARYVRIVCDTPSIV